MNIDTKDQLFTECLHDMKYILYKYNQEFFLCCGTLLGQQRENNFIAHDYDIDIGIIYEKYDPNIILYILQSKKFKFNTVYGNHKNSLEISFIHLYGVRIDIFLFYPIENDKYLYYNASFNYKCDQCKEGFCKWARHCHIFSPINTI